MKVEFEELQEIVSEVVGAFNQIDEKIEMNEIELLKLRSQIEDTDPVTISFEDYFKYQDKLKQIEHLEIIEKSLQYDREELKNELSLSFKNNNRSKFSRYLREKQTELEERAEREIPLLLSKIKEIDDELNQTALTESRKLEDLVIELSEYIEMKGKDERWNWSPGYMYSGIQMRFLDHVNAKMERERVFGK